MGYISETLRTKVTATAKNRCGYCLAHQAYIPWILEIEHIIPVSKGGTDDENNLWMACHSCNLHKGSQIDGIDPLTAQTVPVFNPRLQKWREHFAWSQDGTMIIGLTPVGRVTVLALKLNNIISVTVRKNWVKAGWYPPEVL